MLSFLLACRPEASLPQAEEVDSAQTREYCDIGIKLSPTPGTPDHFYRDPILLSFSQPPGDVSVTLVDASGEPVPGELVVSDTTATFTPSPLQPAAGYAADIQYCGGDLTVDFTTSDFGHSVDPDAIIEQSWVFDVTSGSFILPEASGVMAALTFGQGYLFTVLSADSRSLTLRGGQAERIETDWLQDRCAPTIDLTTPLEFASNPFATVSKDRLDIGWMTMMNTTLSGTFSQDGEQLAGIRFAGVVNVSALIRTFSDLSYNDIESCGLLSGFGLSCIECPDESGPYCLEYELIGVTARSIAPLESRTVAEVALDPKCIGQ